MAGLSLYCAGVVDTDVLTCSSGWQSVVASPPFDPSQLDPAQVVAFVAAGMFAGTTVFATVWGARILLDFLKR